MRTACFTFLLTALLYSAQAADLKIACIDMESVFDKYYKTVTATANLHDTRETYRKHALAQKDAIDAMDARHKELLDQSLNIALSEEARNARKEEARALDVEIKQKKREAIAYNKDKLKNLQETYQKDRDAILTEINTWIQGYAQSNGYDLVIDTSGNNSNNISTVVYYNPAMDITEVTIAALNKGHDAEIAAARAKIEALGAAAGAPE